MVTISQKNALLSNLLIKNKQKISLASQPLGRASVGACDQGGCVKFLVIVTKRSCKRFSGIKEKMFLINL